MDKKEAMAHEHVKTHAMIAAGVGLIPIPLLDVAAISVTQLKLVKTLADHYEVPFSEHRGKALIGALAGATAPGLAAGTARSLLKIIPGVGGILGIVTVPALAGASTYALGKVFTMHFASGGTLLDFDPAKWKAHYFEQFEQGKTVVSGKEKAATSKKATTSKKTKSKPSPATT